MDYQINDDLREKHLMAFSRALKKRQPEEWGETDDLPPMVLKGIAVRAAVDAGWIEGIDADEIGEMRWPEVEELYSKISAALNEATNLEKN